MFSGVEKGCIGNEWVKYMNLERETVATYFFNAEEAYLRSCLTSAMELFVKIVNGFQQLTNLAKNRCLRGS